MSAFYLDKTTQCAKCSANTPLAKLIQTDRQLHYEKTVKLCELI